MNILQILFIAGLSQAQVQLPPPLEVRMKAPLVAAHQGGLYKGRPNSLKQFRDGTKGPADILEMDLQMTSDGVVVIYHDDDLSSGSNCRGPVITRTWAEVSKCRLNNSTELIPSFESVIQAVNAAKIIDAEFKTPDVIEAAIALVQKHRAHEWIYFQCKSDINNYIRARQFDKKVALLFKADDSQKLEWAINNPDRRLMVIELDDQMITSQNIKRVHDNGRLVRVNSWRFDTLQEYKKAVCDKVFKRGIHIANTNRPDSCAKQKSAYKLPL